MVIKKSSSSRMCVWVFVYVKKIELSIVVMVSFPYLLPPSTSLPLYVYVSVCRNIPLFFDSGLGLLFVFFVLVRRKPPGKKRKAEKKVREKECQKSLLSRISLYQVEGVVVLDNARSSSCHNETSRSFVFRVSAPCRIENLFTKGRSQRLLPTR